MTTPDLSVLICARNEMFLSRTVEEILKNIRGNTEVIVFLDGGWADPPIEDDERVTLIYSSESIGQRAATNQACRLSKAKYVMKIDAHCAVDEGFDVKMMAEMQDNYTMIPRMYNLHAFDWVCVADGCEHRIYQGPTPEKCEKCGGKMERDIKWQPRWERKSEFYRFDTTLHFQYHSERKRHPEAKGDIVETMSAQGSCFMLTREKYWELDICDEKHGSWGQQGVEVACKTWLSGGKLVTNKKTWYSHMFRTQGGDFGFPYQISGRQIEKARQYSKDMWMNNKWEKQVYPLSWLIEKFKPLPDWHEESGKQVLKMVNERGAQFVYEEDGGISGSNIKSSVVEGAKIMSDTPTKGIIYYTDNQIPHKFATQIRKHIAKAGLPIVSASLKPIEFGKNIHMKGYTRGFEAYFRQILAALEASDADIIYFCEHDWVYHPSHFDFTPPRKDVYYYNDNWWRIRSQDGLSVHYDTHLLPGIVAYRDILIEHYRNIIALCEKEGFTSKVAYKIGFEPGTHKRVDFVAKYGVEGFKSKYPILDIRHGANLTASKWSQDEFRSQKNCENWVEKQGTDTLAGWGAINDVIKGLYL